MDEISSTQTKFTQIIKVKIFENQDDFESADEPLTHYVKNSWVGSKVTVYDLTIDDQISPSTSATIHNNNNIYFRSMLLN